VITFGISGVVGPSWNLIREVRLVDLLNPSGAFELMLAFCSCIFARANPMRTTAYLGLRAVITIPVLNASRCLIQLRLGCLRLSMMLNFSLCVLKDPVSCKLGGLNIVLTFALQPWVPNP